MSILIRLKTITIKENLIKNQFFYQLKDKIRDIMKNNGARTFGNFDEIMVFFGQHGIFQNQS